MAVRVFRPKLFCTHFAVTATLACVLGLVAQLLDHPLHWHGLTHWLLDRTPDRLEPLALQFAHYSSAYFDVVVTALTAAVWGQINLTMVDGVRNQWGRHPVVRIVAPGISTIGALALYWVAGGPFILAYLVGKTLVSSSLTVGAILLGRAVVSRLPLLPKVLRLTAVVCGL